MERKVGFSFRFLLSRENFAVVGQCNDNENDTHIFAKKVNNIQTQWEKLTKRREPRSSRPSAHNAIPLKREDPTSKVPISTVSSDVNPDLPTDTRTLPLTRRVELSGAKILSLNTLRTPRST